MKIAVFGIGYVGLSNAVLLAQNNTVVAVDLSQERVDQINARVSPLEEAELSEWLATRELDLSATTDATEACADAEFVIVATPTDYDPKTDFFDTSSVESVIALALGQSDTASIVVKSTVPVGFVARMRALHNTDRIFFCPEFLREGQALHDNLHPSRIVVGADSPAAHDFARLMAEAAEATDIPMLFTGPAEAESIKLFANTYLALRVAFFNELDSYALSQDIDAYQIIEGIGLDPRIGTHYNNPSFGYGGYCLPKDTKQMLANFSDVPQNLMRAVVQANKTRKEYIAAHVIGMQPQTVGIHRLVMKSGSDNFRQSSVQGVIRDIRDAGIRVLIYEPALEKKKFMACEVVRDLDDFKAQCDVIVANRASEDLSDVAEKVFTRDIFGKS
ncbi:Nucleotide sugar dehydrogenase [Sulfitobacter noctilucicola]|uniref:UDP-glucose 6-dehydrogenase n=1 Tax=Sulfitobacter noctilucicola TaxID=1342301 RepID=A0A7W6M9Q2_9RHOB|nr:nucleotide sugar dehydrogenase [Sulfitobacter noctilucicola]KIN63453.1 Nucleotide sugar dehydrogenase [Sulfitobacter noctilucicola]MBB4175035.1 UDPglucose 6-dehydrogenase [Sulfitobacter noctilucicola]